MVNQPIVNHEMGIFWCGQIRPYPSHSRSNEDSQMPNLKELITCLLLVLEVWDCKPSYRKSWAGNLFVWSDLTLDPSFKIKRG